MACTPQESVIFAATSIQPTAIKHDVGTLNAMTAFQTDQTKVLSGAGTVGYCFTKPATTNVNCLDVGDGPAMLVRPISVSWAIAANTNGGKSLYRAVSKNGVQISNDEIAAGVNDMQLTYLLSGATSFVDANAVAGQWGTVDAIKLVLTLQPEAGALTTGDRKGTGGQLLTRTVSSTISIRNRKDIRG
ncbi:hypothetical protein Lysil_1094 [Lysobacter silvestris]|uniref:Uncharacterized protein n=2 Tax=Solilutibacter silvestris TaxID=1645665 RepID=A0A2K1Q353_9GAMM|nr:hypothetical protein Lysil_1094 [Lysobacter silvestris]